MIRLAQILLIIAIAVGIYGMVKNLPAIPASRGGAASVSGAAGQTPRDFPTPVTVAKAALADVPVFATGVGTVKALNAVSVKPQIDGKIIEMTFSEGAEIKKGDVLVRLDPVTVKALLDQTLAKKALDEALLANSMRDLDRDNRVGTLGVTQQVIDTQRALVAQQNAQIQSDTAAVDSAKAQLAYADVTSPINGIAGIRQVDIGNVVRSQTDTIVVVAQIQPIAVVFTLPQQQLADVNSGMAGGKLTAEALTTDGGTVLDTGVLQVVDNQVDPTTGTVKFKAEFPNAKRQLWPGQFVSVRLKLNTLKNVVTAPTVAVQQGPAGAFVYLAGDDRKVAMRAVTVSLSDGERSVVTSGLAPGDNVVTTGFSRLKDGAKYSTGRGKPATDATPDGVSAPVAADKPATGVPSASSVAAPASVAATGGTGQGLPDAGAPGDSPPQQGRHGHRKKGTDGAPSATAPNMAADVPSASAGTTQ